MGENTDRRKPHETATRNKWHCSPGPLGGTPLDYWLRPVGAEQVPRLAPNVLDCGLEVAVTLSLNHGGRKKINHPIISTMK